MNRLGLYADKEPHISFSQTSHAYACRKWHEETHWHGREATGEMARWGRTGHEAIAEINLALMRAGSNGIGTEDIERGKRKLIGFRNYHLYSQFCEWVDRYAETTNSERAGIIGVELEIEGWVMLGPIRRNPRKVWVMDLPNGKWTQRTSKNAAVLLKGRLDRLDRGMAPGSCAITDFKMWGSIPSSEDVQHNFQLGLYSMVLRQKQNVERFGLNPMQAYEGCINSIFHNRAARAPLDLKAAEDAERCVKDLIVEMIESVARPATFNRQCVLCPASEKMRCKVFRDEITGAGVGTKVLVASASEYLKLTDRISVFTALKDNLKGKLKQRLEGYGRKPITEGGATAELVDKKGGRLPPGTDAFTTIDEWRTWATSQPHTSLSVSRAR